MKTGVIGLGTMGTEVARNLARARLLKRIWNRTRHKAERVGGELDISISGSPKSLARECELIFISVSGDDDLYDVIDKMLPELKPGKTVIDISTTSVGAARKVAEQVEETGADFLDAPVTGGVEGARRASLILMVGGDDMVLDRVSAILDTISRKQIYMGPSGSGQATKAVNQVMAAGINQAVTEALAFADAMSLDMESVIDVITAGAAGNWFLKNRGTSLVNNDYDVGFKLELHHKDLKICQDMALDMSQGAEIRLPLVEMTLIHYKRLIEAGMGDKDISALYSLKQNMFKIPEDKVSAGDVSV